KKAQKFGVKVRFLEVDEMDKFMKLYLATSERQGFFTHPDPLKYFTYFKMTYGDKLLVPLAYIELDEYIETLTKQNEDLKKRDEQQGKTENKDDETINKNQEMEKQIDNIDDHLNEPREIHELERNTLDLAAGIYFATPYELVYYSGASTSRYPQFVGPYLMH